jgi:hypothetical protein
VSVLQVRRRDYVRARRGLSDFALWSGAARASFPGATGDAATHVLTARGPERGYGPTLCVSRVTLPDRAVADVQ